MRRTILLLALATVVTLTTTAQTKHTLNENAISNLKNGIESENTGLKRSAIYFAGYYKVDEMVESIREEMLNSNDPQIQVLAALALYEIGDERVMSDLIDLSNNETEEARVRQMAKAIFDTWERVLENNYAVVSH